jgi:hypothetical protein
VANPTTIPSPAVSQKIAFIFSRNYHLFGDLLDDIRLADSSNNIKEERPFIIKIRYFERYSTCFLKLLGKLTITFSSAVSSCSARDWERSGLLEENPQSGCSDICASLKGPL